MKKQYWVDPLKIEFTKVESAEFTEFGDTPAIPGKTSGSADGLTTESRRDFMKLMGASFAMFGASACVRRPVEKIIPYVRKPNQVTPGVANYYASTCTECDTACGIVVKTREGRPIKFEGNPEHPASKGGLCARGQASVLGEYDPDRVQSALAPGRKGAASAIEWSVFDDRLALALRSTKSAGKKVRVLTGEINSPSLRKVIGEFASATDAKHVVFEPLAPEALANASELAYGERRAPRYRFDRADFILSFGADFLGTWGDPVGYARDWAAKRKLGSVGGGKKEMSRFVALESVLTMTGANADERHTLPAGLVATAAMGIAHEVLAKNGGDASLRSALEPYTLASVAAKTGLPEKALAGIAHELIAHKGKSLVLGGGHVVTGEEGLALELAVNILNSALGNEGTTVDSAAGTAVKSSFAALSELVHEMNEGQVGVLIVADTNPVYALPAAAGFTAALAKVGTVATFSQHFDETARVSDLVGALSHATESWGDASGVTGVYGIVQPTIAPMHKTRAFGEALLELGRKLGANYGATANWYEYVRKNWRENLSREVGGGASFDLFWDKLLRDGFAGKIVEGRGRSLAASRAADVLRGQKAPEAGMQLTLYPKVSQYDGRNANNGWLQELPDPVTKITWDNYLCVSPVLASKQNLKDGDVVQLKVGSAQVEVPVHVQPGQLENTLALAVGYGRDGVGRVGSGVGVNAFQLAGTTKRGLEMSGLAASITKTGKTSELACTQMHHSMEGRKIVVEADLKEYQKNGKAGLEGESEDITMWPKHQYTGYRWRMAIDLTACTGCSACVVGCQAENNIPVVGKKFVLTNREMHWLRIDRYYSGRTEHPEVVNQPILCQHCENAPCETVCPVLATVHDHEGLNQQVYNRCVGTRYCANNCPYKVRRFNWFTFSDVDFPLNLQYNPDLSVRTRGVMEKCTFCMQRIKEVKDHAKMKNTVVTDGEMKTACQQSCPTGAISFGNSNDKESHVSKVGEDERAYLLLEELNVKPSISYLTKIRNKGEA